MVRRGVKEDFLERKDITDENWGKWREEKKEVHIERASE
jgi:hypothetical protein